MLNLIIIIINNKKRNEGKKTEDIEKFGYLLEKLIERFPLQVRKEEEEDVEMLIKINDLIYSTTQINPQNRPKSFELLSSLLSLPSPSSSV